MVIGLSEPRGCEAAAALGRQAPLPRSALLQPPASPAPPQGLSCSGTCRGPRPAACCSPHPPRSNCPHLRRPFCNAPVPSLRSEGLEKGSRRNAVGRRMSAHGHSARAPVVLETVGLLRKGKSGQAPASVGSPKQKKRAKPQTRNLPVLQRR